MRRTIRLGVVLTAIAALTAAGSAAALTKRAPTLNERVAVTRAMPAWLRAYPAGCVYIIVTMSNNGRYAEAGYGLLVPRRTPSNDPCLRYASNGSWILRKDAGRWTIIYNGSDGPSCSLHVPRDLQRCR